MTTSTPQLYSLTQRVLQKKREQALEAFHEAYKLQLQRDYSSAIEKYRESIEIFPTAEAHTFLGWAYSFLGDLDSAIAECRRAIELDPDFGNPYNDIGAYLIAQGHHDEAVPYLQHALESKRYRAYHFAHFNLGRAKERQGDLLSAFRHYKSAVQIEPHYLMAQQALEHLKRCKLN
jgi:tetratricopeptide (TPR) repeat protein